MKESVESPVTKALEAQEQARFEQLVVPHLDAAFNLARWILRGRADAEDATQEAMLRAYRFFGGFNGTDARAWLLQIVRNACFTWLDKNRHAEQQSEFVEESHPDHGSSPETLAIAANQRERLTRALEGLAPRYREMIVLRELQGCSYKEIAAITSIPIGSVMSALSRAREQLRIALAGRPREEAAGDV
jgi:RNA polymerase sigma-70 factor (ECF subfamily)